VGGVLNDPVFMAVSPALPACNLVIEKQLLIQSAYGGLNKGFRGSG